MQTSFFSIAHKNAQKRNQFVLLCHAKFPDFDSLIFPKIALAKFKSGFILKKVSLVIRKIS